MAHRSRPTGLAYTMGLLVLVKLLNSKDILIAKMDGISANGCFDWSRRLLPEPNLVLI